MGMAEGVLASSTLKYKHQVKMRLALMIAMFIWGALAIVISFVGSNAKTVASLQDAGISVHVLSESMQGFYRGFGVGFMGAAAVFVIINLYLLINKKAQANRRVRDLDERNVAIQQRATSLTAAITIILAAFAIIVAGVFNTAVMFTLIAVNLIMGAIYGCAWLILRSRS
ncbi:MAG: hypothetical protein FWF45_00060 [Coriobacteriia bacterium]|nr:hypothetical protein [Coriobacteriia bacterium]